MKYATVLHGIFETAIKHFPKFLEENSVELGNRKGIYLVGMDLAQNDFLMSGMILGELPQEKISEKIGFALEKITRVLKGKHFTTFPTQNYSLGKYGGGVKVPGTVALSCSGFPPALDHKFVIEVLTLSGNLSEQNQQLIMAEFELYREHGVTMLS